jgi:hypothetical protein
VTGPTNQLSAGLNPEQYGWEIGATTALNSGSSGNNSGIQRDAKRAIGLLKDWRMRNG